MDVEKLIEDAREVGNFLGPVNGGETLLAMADALESLNRENKELSDGMTTEWGTEIRDDHETLLDRDEWNDEKDARRAAATYGHQLIRRAVGPWVVVSS